MSNQTITFNMPSQLLSRLEQEAEKQNLSLNQLAVSLLSRQVAQIESIKFFEKRLAGKIEEQILSSSDRVLKKINARSIPNWDEL